MSFSGETAPLQIISKIRPARLFEVVVNVRPDPRLVFTNYADDSFCSLSRNSSSAIENRIIPYTRLGVSPALRMAVLARLDQSSSDLRFRIEVSIAEWRRIDGIKQ